MTFIAVRDSEQALSVASDTILLLSVEICHSQLSSCRLADSAILRVQAPVKDRCTWLAHHRKLLSLLQGQLGLHRNLAHQAGAFGLVATLKHHRILE